MTATNLLDPESSRRPGAEGVGFTLSDGRRWLLAIPRLYWKPVFIDIDQTSKEAHKVPPERGRTELVATWDYPPPARQSVRRMLDAVCSDSPTFPLEVVVEPALALLRLCHDISTELAIELLTLTRDEIETLAVGMLRMFRGQDPDFDPASQPELQSEEPEIAKADA